MRNAVIKVGLLILAYIFISTPDVSALSAQHLVITEKPFKYANSLLVETDKEPTPKKTTPKVEPEEKPAVLPPPVITYTVAEGDSLTKIAETHTSTVERLYAKNIQIENPDMLSVGQQLTVPGADEQLQERPLPARAIQTPQLVISNANVSSSAPAIPRGSSSGNTYYAGYCTWYAKNRRPDLPNSLGNANTWVARAAGQGLATGNAPQVGAIGQQGMHVVYVEAVNGDGTVTISEMNYRGLHVVSSRTVPASTFSYIY